MPLIGFDCRCLPFLQGAGVRGKVFLKGAEKEVQGSE
jgi:hypothetical protein